MLTGCLGSLMAELAYKEKNWNGLIETEMETKSIDCMSREELMGRIIFLQRELEKAQNDSDEYYAWWKEAREMCRVIEQKMQAFKALVSVL